MRILGMLDKHWSERIAFTFGAGFGYHIGGGREYWMMGIAALLTLGAMAIFDGLVS